MRRFLYINAEHPLIGAPGSNRLARFLKYLPAHGWSATILTQVIMPWHEATDESNREFLSHPHRVVRVPAVDLSAVFGCRRCLLKSFRRMLSRFRKSAGRGANSKKVQAPIGRLTRLWDWIAVPDYTAGWGLTATPVGICLALRCNAIVASAPEWTNLLMGYDISRVTRRPLIVDMRDPWSIGGLIPKSPAWRVRYDNRLEQQVFQHAAAVVLNTERARMAYAEKYPELAPKFTTITNGFDPWTPGPCPPRIDPEKFQLVHIGTVTSARRDPTTFFDGMRQFLDLCPEARDHLRVTFLGSLRSDYLEFAVRIGLEPYIEPIAAVPHKLALDYTSHAPMLLLLGEVGVGNEYTVQAKAYEYLAAQRPIIGILPPKGANADLIEKHGAGCVLDITSPKAIAEGLARRFTAWKKNNTPTFDIPPTEYSGAELTKRLVSLLEKACGMTEVGANADGTLSDGGRGP